MRERSFTTAWRTSFCACTATRLLLSRMRGFSAWVSCIVGRGVALSLLSRHDEAMEAFDEVLRTDPEFFDRWPEVAPHYQLSSRETERNTQGGSS